MSGLHLLILQRLFHKVIMPPLPKFEVNKSEIAMTFILELFHIYKELKKRPKHQKHKCLPSAVWS